MKKIYSQKIRTGKDIEEEISEKQKTPKFYNPKNKNRTVDIMECRNQFSKRKKLIFILNKN